MLPIYFVLYLFFLLVIRRPTISTRTDTLFPYTPLVLSAAGAAARARRSRRRLRRRAPRCRTRGRAAPTARRAPWPGLRRAGCGSRARPRFRRHAWPPAVARPSAIADSSRAAAFGPGRPAAAENGYTGCREKIGRAGASPVGDVT